MNYNKFIPVIDQSFNHRRWNFKVSGKELLTFIPLKKKPEFTKNNLNRKPFIKQIFVEKYTCPIDSKLSNAC